MTINYNDPAIKGVSEAAMSEACRAPTKRSEDEGAVFANHGTNFQSYTCVAVQY